MTTRPKRAVAALIIVTMASTAGAVAPTSAAWVQQEHAHASLGALDCATTDDYSSTATGDLITANPLGAPLETLIDVDDLTVTVAAGGTAVPDPITAVAVGPGAYANPLSVSALNGAITTAGALDGVLTVAAGADAGLLNQYARVATAGEAVGASGLVSNSGAIALARPAPASSPSFATLSLASVVSAVLGAGAADLVGEVSRLTLELGAVAALARLDQCDAEWAVAGALQRDYAIADLDLDIASPLVAALVATARSTMTRVETLDSADPAVAVAIAADAGSLLAASGLGLAVGSATTSLNLAVDWSTVNTILTTPFGDAGGLVVVDPAAGTIGIDLDAVVNAVDGLNALAPNTEVLINEAMIASIESALIAAIGDWALDLTTAMSAALAAAVVSGTVSLSVVDAVTGAPTATIGLAVSGASLASLVAGTAGPAASLTVTVLVTDVGGTLAAALTALFDPELQSIVGNAITTAVTAATTELGATLRAAADATTDPLVRLVAGLTRGLFGPAGVASLLVNVQNDPVTGSPEPADWSTIPAGRYDVAAVRLVVLGLLVGGRDLDLVLARGSAGPVAR